MRVWGAMSPERARAARSTGSTVRCPDEQRSPKCGAARTLLFLGLVLAGQAHAQRRLPIELDAGAGNDPVQTTQKLVALYSATPSYFSVPANFPALPSGPDSSPPAVTVWLPPELAAQYQRAADAGTAPMAWPAPVLCAQHAAFALPSTLLVSGAAAGCSAHEATVRAALTASALSACLEVEEPERYMAASRAPATLGPNDQSGRVSFADSHTNDLEAQIAFAGAALGSLPVPQGLLPPDFVPVMRSILWKIRAATATTGRLQQARNAYATALVTLLSQSACFEPSVAASVQALDAELVALSARVNQVIADGTARANVQRQCLATRSRTRPQLAFAALTDEERETLAFWLGGIYWRMRGGGLFNLAGATQSSRSLFARRPFGSIARLGCGPSSAERQAAERAADSIYCGLGDGWGAWMDMGTYMNASLPPEENQDFFEDLVQMTNRGRQHTFDFPAEARLFCIGQGVFTIDKSPEEYLRDDGYDSVPFAAGGMSMGPCYAYALNPMKAFTYFGNAQAPAPYSGFIEGHTTMGEFCIGASMAQGLVRSLLNGKPNNMPATNFCAGRQCGVDQCGVSCGTCMSGMTCDASGLCISGGTAGGSGGSAGGGAAGGGAAGGATAGGASAGGAAGGSAGGGEATGGGSGTAGGGGGPGGGTGGTAGGGAPGGGRSEPDGPRGCGCGSSPPLAGTFFALALRRRRRRRAS